jgi:hypothetical protein
LDALSSPAWWVSVVIVGVLINLVSAYLKPTLDTRLSKASGWWKARAVAEQRARHDLVERLKKSSHEQMLACFAEQRYRIRSVYMLVFGAFMLLVTGAMPFQPYEAAITMTLAIGAMSLFTSFHLFSAGIRIKRALVEAIGTESVNADGA